MPLEILGLGTAVPPDVTSQADALRAARILGDPAVANAPWLKPVYERSGVNTRHQVLGFGFVEDVFAGTRTSESPFLAGADSRGPSTGARMTMYAEHAPKLALDATLKAIADAKIAPGSITHLVTVSCTGFIAPGIDMVLIQALGLRPTVERLHIGYMGCHGAINGLRATLALASDPSAVILMVCTELCSVHYYTGPVPDKVVANALFADGSAAIIARGSPSGLRVTATGSCVIPNTVAEMGWTIHDHGFEMTLSQQIAPLIGTHLRPWLSAWLATRNLNIEQIHGWAIHPGGPRILSAVQECLPLSVEQIAASRAILSEFGNMSSPTVLFILQRLLETQVRPPMVLIAFGPGLVAEAALVE
jgi:alpha-pyrone synthase